MQTETDIRERVLDRSTEHFLRRGFSRVTSDELAREAGISKRTLYQHFRSKEEILGEVIEREMGRIAALLDQACGDGGLSFTEKLKAVLRIVAAQLSRLGPTMLEDIYHSAPRLWARIEQSRQQLFYGRLEALIRQGTEQGHLRRDVDLRVSLALLQAALQHVMTPDQVVRLSLSPMQLFDSLLRILLSGLLTDEARRQMPEPPAEGDPR